MTDKTKPAPKTTAGHTFNLTYGIEVDGKAYEQIHLRRAKARDTRTMPQGDPALGQMQLIANLASIPEGPSTVPLEAIDDMDSLDYMMLNKYVNEHFFGLAPMSSPKPS